MVGAAATRLIFLIVRLHDHLLLVREEIYTQVSTVLLVVARVVHRELLLLLLVGGNFLKADFHRSQAKMLNFGLGTLVVLELVRVRFHYLLIIMVLI